LEEALIPNPILKVLSSMRGHRVQCLLMGGQACVFYGAAEFSRDTDLAILASDENLDRLKAALTELQAETIAVPDFDIAHLLRGHAVHFRCRHPEATGMRVDVMSSMRGVDPFPKLWERRTTLETPDGTLCDLLSLPDLVQAKKTQRDKDWPMIRRLVEAHYFEFSEAPNEDQIRFWLRELRTPSLLLEVAARWPDETRQQISHRSLLEHALARDEASLESALSAEEQAERLRDKEYWLPLKKELEAMRKER
jgi:hypothetical protein